MFVAGSMRVIACGPSHVVFQTATAVTANPPHGMAAGMGIVAWIAFVIASIRTTANAFGMSTQMLPSPLASQFGPELPAGPTTMVATTLFVAGSMRSTLPSWVSATHTAVAVARTPFGARPAGITATTLEVAGSMR